jgi:amicoumacin kinase
MNEDHEGPPAVEAVRRWFPAAAELVHIQDSDNSVYSFVSGGPARRYFLRLTHREHRQFDQIQAELDFILYLSGAGLGVSRPVSSSEDCLIEKVSADFFACVFEAAPGSLVEVGSTDWNEKLFQTWGNFMARMHRAADFYVPRGPRRFRWDEDEVIVNFEKHLPPTETSARREFDLVINYVTGQSNESIGLIHGDLCRVNFHYDGTDLIAFDFDDACYHWFVYDLVCALSPAMFRPMEERRAYRDWLVQGYQQIKSLPENWSEQFDWLLRLRNLYIFAHYLRKTGGKIENHPKRRLLELLRDSFDNQIAW